MTADQPGMAPGPDEQGRYVTGYNEDGKPIYGTRPRYTLSQMGAGMSPPEPPSGPTYRSFPPRGEPHWDWHGMPRADADGAAIAALITAWFVPPLGIIFGHVSRAQARRRNMRPSVVANLGTVLGWLGTIGWVIVVALIVAAAHQGTPPPPCDYTNPNYPYC